MNNRIVWGMVGAVMLCGPAFGQAPLSAESLASEAPAQCEWRPAGPKFPDRMLLYCRRESGAFSIASVRPGFDMRTMAKARAGDPAAMTNLGVFYIDGPENLRDLKAATDLFRHAAEAGVPEAMFDLALAMESKAVPQNGPDEIRRLYRAAAEKGYVPAMLNLARLEITAASADDVSDALHWMSVAADTGHADALVDLGDVRRRGIGGPIDPKAAADFYRKAAEKKNRAAQFRLGLAYADGSGVEHDEAQALTLLLASTEASRGLIGMIAAMDFIVRPQTTAETYRKQIQAGDSRTALKLGFVLAQGKYVRKDAKQAAKLLRFAADHGERAALVELGQLYALGDGVPRDQKEAIRLLREGGAAMYPDQLHHATWYDGVPRS